MPVRLSRKEAVASIVPSLLKLRRETPKTHPVIVAVVGASASGKGHLINELRDALNGADEDERDDVAVLALDNYYRGRKIMEVEKIPHFDHPDALELRLAAKHLSEMRVGKSLDIPCYDFAKGERVGQETFTAKPFVFADRLFALRPEIRPCAHYSVFIETDVHSALLRRLFRDAGPKGRTKQRSRDVLEQYFTTVVPAKRAFIDPTTMYADVMVVSQYNGINESIRAGGMQYQCKARGTCDDDVIHVHGGLRLGSSVKQEDTFLAPKGGKFAGELLRLRRENGSLFLTYKGPFLDSLVDVGVRAVTQAIEIDPGSEAWFKDDYDIVATFEKQRRLFHAGDLLIACDTIPHLGTFVEARALNEAAAAQLRTMLGRLGLPKRGEPIITESYFDLWQKRRNTPIPVPDYGN